MATLAAPQQYTVTLRQGLMDDFAPGNVWSLPSGHFVKLMLYERKAGGWLTHRVNPVNKQVLPDSEMLLSPDFLDAYGRLCWTARQWERKAI